MPNAIQTENALAGSTGYILTSGTTKREIEGYWSSTSVDPGGTIALKVQSGAYAGLAHSLSDFTLKIYRMGFYGGLGGRLVLDAGTIPGIAQPAPIIYSNYGGTNSAYHGCAECQWTTNYTLTVPADWVPGRYIGVLTRVADGLQQQTIFTVRGTGDILLCQPVYTYHAYNRWGGRGSYGADLANYPEINWGAASGPSLRVSLNRPYAPANSLDAAWMAQSTGSGRFFMHSGTNKYSSEHDLVMRLEEKGYDVGYCTQEDRHADAALIAGARVLMTTDHDEYWSAAERANVIARRDAGGHCCFLSGNDCYWRVRPEVDSQGRANRVLANYKDDCSEDLGAATLDEKTGLWAGRVVLGNTADTSATVASEPEESVLGTQFDGGIGEFNGVNVNNPTHWAWAGAGVVQDQALKSIRGHEWNNSWTLNNSMARFHLPATSGVDRRSGAAPPGTFVSLLWNPANLDTSTDSTQPAATRGRLYDGGVYQAPSGAWVFSAGFTWFGLALASSPVRVPSFRASDEDPALKILLDNVLQAMGALPGASGGTPPPSYVWEYQVEVRAAGSQVWSVDTPWATYGSGQRQSPQTYPAGTYEVSVQARDRAVPTDLSQRTIHTVTLTVPGPITSLLAAYYQLAAAGGLGDAI